MTGVAIVGVGMAAVGEHWGQSLRHLVVDAARAALAEAGIARPDALYVGNAYGGTISSQTHLGALVADHAGLAGIEAYTVEAAEASGGAALRAGVMAVASGLVETALVVGVEKMTDTVAAARVAGRNVSIDADLEAPQGATLTALTALLMRRYMHVYGVPLEAFEGFSVNAHLNGSRNSHAMFRNKLRAGAFAKAPLVSDPVSLFDAAPDADGAAAVLLAHADRAADMVPLPVSVAGSAAATDTFALQDRADLLHLAAVARSTAAALAQASITREQVSLFELHDAATILAVLSLEAAGFAAPGEGWQWAANSGERIGTTADLPLSTFGGLKARGNPAGATGVYQAVEAVLQLRGHAADNQVPGAQVALVQNLGGLGTTAITHVLRSLVAN